MSATIRELRPKENSPQYRLEMARLAFQQARLAYAQALAEVGQMSLEDSRILAERVSPTTSPLDDYAELERLREEARTCGGFSLLK